MKLTKLLPILLLSVFLSSCGTLIKSRPFAMPSAKLEMSMQDFVFLGESEVSCEYDTYLGFIYSWQKINGEMYDPNKNIKLNIPGINGVFNFSCKGMQLACAKLLKEYPDAHFFQVVWETKETDRLFLGTSVKRMAKVRAYKFK